MASVRQRQPQSTGDNRPQKNKGGLLFAKEEEGLEIKYVVFILIIVFMATFVATLYCLGLIGDHSLLPGLSSPGGEHFDNPPSGEHFEHHPSGEHFEHPLSGDDFRQVQEEDALPLSPDGMPSDKPRGGMGPPKQDVRKPKSDKISSSTSSDYEPPIREAVYVPPAPENTILDKPTILWWTEALYPHHHQGLKAEIKCGQSTCLSTVHKDLLSDPMTRGVMFYGTDVRSYEMPLPREPWHEWALLHEESPQNNYLLTHAPMLRLFNHTSTFHRSSHYPLTTQNVLSLDYLVERKPVPLKIKNEFRRNGTLAPIVYVQSHCDVPSDRDRYVQRLMKYIDVDSYGKCAHNKDLPPDLRNPVDSMFDEKFYDLLSKYKFNLAFENALCPDYITEKFYRPLYLGSVPITKATEAAQDWAPDKHSIIISEDFNGPEKLAEHINFLDQNDEEYLKYLEFKNTGITNQNLIKTVAQRPWGVTQHGHVSFITGFECYVCEKLVERWEAEKAHAKDPSHPLLPPSIARYSHMPCPEPVASVYPIEEAGDTTDIQAWKDDFWFNLDQANALKYMVENGHKDSEKVFDVVDKLRRRHNRRNVR